MEQQRARLPAGSGYERLTADEMDERRHQSIAYQYLCHLEEAKRWMEACLKEPLPPPTELEESLRNGVTLAKLGHLFAPDVCPLGKIYDLTQARFEACGLHFRHTDNINRWRDAMSHVGLPQTFHPETTDLYEKKNLPRVVYCIHALSLYLFKRGLAPQIQDLYGKVDFTDEEIDHAAGQLEKYGLQLPSFSKIGGILARELSVDEAAVHAAVLAINAALEAGIVAETLGALRNPSARLEDLRESLAAAYQDVLLRAKAEKAESAQRRHLKKIPDGEDVYDRCLTQAEIQRSISRVNVRSALERVDDALDGRDPEALDGALQDPALALRGLRQDNASCYLGQLSADREQKALELGYAALLEQEEIQEGLCVANERNERERAAAHAVSLINASLRRGLAEESVRALASPEAQLPDVFPFAAELYQRELSALQRQHPQGALVQEELFVAVEMLSAVALVNRALEDGDGSGFWRSLLGPNLGLSGVRERHAQRYFDGLSQQRRLLREKGRHFLSWNDIQALVNEVNGVVQEEDQRVLAVRLINEALEGDCPEKTLTALLLPSAGLGDVTLPRAGRYHFVLTDMQRRKAQATGEARAPLWWDEIQEGVSRANRDSQAAKQMALGLAAINQAIKEGNAAQTVRVLRNPDVGLCGVEAECAMAYQSQLGAIAAARRNAGNSRGLWLQHRMTDGSRYYFNLQSLEGAWEPCGSLVLHGEHLSREEIQAVVSRVASTRDRQRLWESHAWLVLRLQARMRGFLVRRKFAARQKSLSEQQPAAVKIQAAWRGYQQRRRYRQRLAHLRRNTAAVLKIQSWVRMLLARKRYLERLSYFRRNVQAVVKIQAFLRANKAREDYRILAHSENPPLRVIRRFAHLLERSQRDYAEEQELLDLQESVVRGIRFNQQLENDLNLMDIKIGLLVKNRITLQEVVSHCKKLTGKNKEELSDRMAWGKGSGLKALSRERRKALEAYQHLFYHLQTHPVYLARLITQLPPTKSTKFVESVVFSLYSYASSARDAFLLLRLFRCALQEEVATKVTRPREILTGNPTAIRLVVSFYRNGRGQNALRDILAEPVQEVLQNRGLRIRTNPLEVYRGWINETESQSGQKSHLPYDVTPEQALCHPEVRRRLDDSLGHLLVLADRFLSAILSSVDKIPYGMRYVAKVLKTSLAGKFPDAAEEEIDKVVGNLLYYRFMNPAVVAPDGFDVVDLSPGAALQPDQRHNLASVAKILQHAAADQPFEGENGHLNVINRFLEETHQKLRMFFNAACLVPEPEERFNVDKYSEMVAITKPVVYVTVGELVNTHKLLLEHQASLAPDAHDPLHELLQDLGELPTVRSLIGCGPGTNGERQQAPPGPSGTELALTLSSKHNLVVPEAEGGTKAEGLWLSTKEMLVDVIQSQPGDSLVGILRTEASKVEEKKRRILTNLEVLGRAASASQEQGLVSEIAKDIRLQRQRRQQRKTELARLQRTLRALGSKKRFYEEQADSYQRYIQACLPSLASGRKPSKKQAVLQYSAARLLEKGVLLAIEDLPLNQLRNVIFEIVPSGEAGTFRVKAKFMGVDMENFQLRYQDLLQLQYEGVAIMKMFDKAKVNVNLLIFLLNKKFFKK